jgi:spermidine/putrescine transport system permease protein
MNALDRKLGFLSSLPLTILLLISFLAPMAVVALFSVMPARFFILFSIFESRLL